MTATHYPAGGWRPEWMTNPTNIDITLHCDGADYECHIYRSARNDHEVYCVDYTRMNMDPNKIYNPCCGIFFLWYFEGEGLRENLHRLAPRTSPELARLIDKARNFILVNI